MNVIKYLQNHLNAYTCNGIPVLIIDIPKGFDTPYFLKTRSIEEGAYTRVGSTSRLADREMLARLIREGKNISFDSETISSNLEFYSDFVQEYFEKRNARLGAPIPVLSDKVLEDIFALKGGCSTVAGALLFSKKPQDIPEFGNACIRAARFKGEKKGVFIDQKELLGPLSEQVDEGVNFVLRNTRLLGAIEGAVRKDQYEYPPEIVREILVNAVVHRDYSISGSAILLSVFDDRIEVTSPGGLPGTVSTENILDRQYNRNPIIAKRMFEMGYFDSWGQGIDLIYGWAEKQGVKDPTFLDETGQFTITIYPESDDTSKEKTKTNDPLTTREEAVYKHIQKSKKITNSEIQKTFNLSKTQVQVVLRKLLEKNLLQRNGSGRGTYYTVLLP